MADRKSDIVEHIATDLWWRHQTPELLWLEGDIRAVFDPATGQTHLLNELPALLLHNLTEEKRSALQLLDDLSGESFSAGGVEAGKVYFALQSLHNAELVDTKRT